jgi:hypothetical protein
MPAADFDGPNGHKSQLEPSIAAVITTLIRARPTRFIAPVRFVAAAFRFRAFGVTVTDRRSASSSGADLLWPVFDRDFDWTMPTLRVPECRSELLAGEQLSDARPCPETCARTDQAAFQTASGFV